MSRSAHITTALLCGIFGLHLILLTIQAVRTKHVHVYRAEAVPLSESLGFVVFNTVLGLALIVGSIVLILRVRKVNPFWT